MKNLFCVLLFGALITGFGSIAAAQAGGTVKVKLYFAKADPEADNEVYPVERTIKKTARVADAALRELLKGVTEEDRKNGLASSYEVGDIVTGREECASDKIKPLRAYLIGVTIRRGVAIVNFRPEAECYLQSAAFAMARVMNPIDATLKQFKAIKRVEYALNGKIITEWDA
jgi:spore germination protein GerM